MTDDAQFKATPAEMLERRIMDPCVSKSEAEWWARAEIERLREALYEERLTVATVVSLKAMEERLEKENDALRRQARKASRSRDAVVRMREKLLAEVERLREEVKHGHVAHKAACEGGDLLREEIERLTRERDEARADAAALREVLIDARDKVEWIGCSPEGQQEMNRMRDDCLCRIDAVLARAAPGGGR